MCRQAWIYAALISLPSATRLRADPPAADKKPQTAQVVLKVPAKFPVGLETVVAGDLIGTNADASAWSIHRPGQPPTAAQRDLLTGKLWFRANVDKSSLGKTLRYAATQDAGRHAVALSRTKPLVLRHRLVLHRGDAEAARIADQQQIYETTWSSQPEERK